MYGDGLTGGGGKARTYERYGDDDAAAYYYPNQNTEDDGHNQYYQDQTNAYTDYQQPPADLHFPEYSMGSVLVDPSQYITADHYGDGSETTPMVQHEEQPFRIEGTIISDDGPSSQKKKKKKKKGEKSFYQLGYYKELFDFDTDVILHRIWNASNPTNYVEFWEDTKDQPDFYVPLWGATTLWFLLVVCGDFGASFVNEHCTVETYYFDKVGWGAFAVYGYLFILPICWFLCFKFWLDIPLGLFGHICLYGYSLLPYIPTMFFGLIPYPTLRWIPFGLSCVLSSMFLGGNYHNYLRAYTGQGMMILAVMMACSAGLAVLFKVLFFGTC